MAHADTDYEKPGHRRIGALVLIRNATGHVLLVKPTYKPGMIMVGGGALPDEPPHEAALREAIEETGIRHLAIGDLLITDYVRANAYTGSVEGLNLVFDGGVVADDVVVKLPAAKPGQRPELSEWAFVRPDQLGERCQPYQRRRISAALAALEDPVQRGYRVEGDTIWAPR